MKMSKEVEQVLQESIRARNDDRYLILKVWERHGLVLTEEQQYKFYSAKMPSSETIRRTRQKLQEEGKYTAYNPVKAARKQKAEETRVQMASDDQSDMFGHV